MKKASAVVICCLICIAVSAEEIPQGSVNSLKSVRMAIKDLAESYSAEYVRMKEYLAWADAIAQMSPGSKRDEALRELRRKALLDNPLLKFRDLLLVRRRQGCDGLPCNWQGNERLSHTGYGNDIAVLSLDRLDDPLQTVFRPQGDLFVGDLDLHFDARRLLFSMPGKNGRWQVHEIKIDPKSVRAGVVPRELPLIPDGDVDNYDACYLPDGNILFTSTATYTGVPCVRGGSHVANIYRLEVETGEVRRLTFDQDHNWNPTVLNNGRVMYLRWEYSDLPHFAARILFHMNPDGTNQAEYYGSGSYWPNSTFYARAVPDHPTRVAGIVTGHHGTRRAGELVIFDPALGRHEADGVVQRIPGHGKTVEAVIVDKLVDQSWPKFLHPYPLSSKYFLVAAKRNDASAWAIYLADVFDNMVLLRAEKGFDLLEPIPLLRRPLPPRVPNRVDLRQSGATVYLEDVYQGNAMKGVPRGVVKNLRLLTYHFAYRGMGGQQDPLGVDGPWDIKCVLGTVPVEPDGSALFRVPANTPISFQPLDTEGKAIQLMRSWTTAMPGENVSCVGCHAPQNAGPPVKNTIAVRRQPSKIAPWYGPVRGFSFKREVEPVVDHYCGECHRAKNLAKKEPLAGKPAPPQIKDPYMFLRRLVRTPTMEPDMHPGEPYEFYADTTELVRMLQTGHYGVRLDAEAWDRIVTWIDLNTPRHGSWTENVGRQRMGDSVRRRRDLMRRYAGIDGIDENPAELTADAVPEVEPPAGAEMPAKKPRGVKILNVSSNDAKPAVRIVDLGEGSKLELVRIPAGEFLAGDAKVKIAKPFWMAKDETTNAQYAMFDPAHDSRLEPGDFLHFDPVRRGTPLNEAEQPVAKVSWRSAADYCRWLSKKTGFDVGLPTEQEWEWACRAGSQRPFWYGDQDAGFSEYANLADLQFRGAGSRKSHGRFQWRPAIADQDDGYRVSAPVGSFKPNPWGLRDMHGNVAEWTASVYQPATDRASTKRVVRGGSWSDRPKWATAAARWGYKEHQKVYNVGFRIVVRNKEGT